MWPSGRPERRIEDLPADAPARRERPLSPQQIAMLMSIYRYGNPYARVRGHAQHGGASGTVASIQRRGLAEWRKREPGASREWALTETGLAAVRDARAARRAARRRR